MIPFSLDDFHQKYDTDVKDLSIRNRSFEILVPKSIDAFIDLKDILHDFPLWSKIWDASIVLADHLAALPPNPEKHFLEIGCGMGLVGVVAACFGHRVTLTEQNADALNFARANAALNACENGGDLNIVELDWNRPTLYGSFDHVIGSEVIYKERDYDPLLNLFRSYLSPGGTIILAERARKTSIEFFRQMSALFDITARKKILRLDGEAVPLILADMAFKPEERPRIH